jgi:hypothetical protein
MVEVQGEEGELSQHTRVLCDERQLFNGHIASLQGSDHRDASSSTRALFKVSLKVSRNV